MIIKAQVPPSPQKNKKPGECLVFLFTTSAKLAFAQRSKQKRTYAQHMVFYSFKPPNWGTPRETRQSPFGEDLIQKGLIYFDEAKMH